VLINLLTQVIIMGRGGIEMAGKLTRAKLLINQQELRQETIAEQLGVTGGWLSSVLNGHRGKRLAPDKLAKLAEILGVPPEQANTLLEEVRIDDR
jgi:transcriptional regulator with XRE-family HTH domain